MTTKRVDTLRTLVLLLTAHWFFGNLYEKIVMTPNILFGSIPDGIDRWNKFSWLTNPIYYFQPWDTILLVLSWLVSIKANRTEDPHKLADRNVAWGVSTAAVLTIVIITQVNLKLYFPTTVLERASVEKTYLIGILLGGLRLLAEGYALFYSIKSIRTPLNQPLS